MAKPKIALFSAILLIALPLAVRADETGSVTEDFGGTSRREERGTYAFFDTRNKEVILPLQYTIQEVTHAVPATVASTLRFSEVVNRFSRIPTGRISADAKVVETGGITFALSSRLYADLGSGVEMSSGVIAELVGMTMASIDQSEAGKLLISGRKGSRAVVFELSVRGFAPSAAVESKKMTDAGSGKFFKSAAMNAQFDRPEGTTITFMLSGDGGQHWEEVTPGVSREFIYQGGDLRYRATLVSTVPMRTPHLMRVKIDFIKAPYETPATIRTRDNKRVSDLKNVAIKLDKFKKDRNSYPIADDQDPAVRWNIVAQLLKEGNYLTPMPQDPLHDKDTARAYDYIGGKSGTSYVLRARLEDAAHASLVKDLDGKPVEPNLYDYSCDEPWYCEGKGVLVRPTPAPVAPAIVGTAEILQDEQGHVYRIATIGGGATPVEKRKIYIPSPALLGRLRTFYSRMQKVGRQTLEEIPRARLVKTADKNDIYYITQANLKRHIPSWEIFKSYGNDRREVVTVLPEELAAYPDSRLIRLMGDKNVWYLENGARRLVKSPAVMKKQGLKWAQVAPVNYAEYNSYPEGAPLQ